MDKLVPYHTAYGFSRRDNDVMILRAFSENDAKFPHFDHPLFKAASAGGGQIPGGGFRQRRRQRYDPESEFGLLNYPNHNHIRVV